MGLCKRMAHPGHGEPILPNFPIFYESWLTDLKSFLQHLLQSAGKEDAQIRAINQILTHYHQYYDHLSRAAVENVFRVLSAPWLTTFERTLLWIAGFKPSLIFRFLASAVKDLTPTQAARVEELKLGVTRRERELTEAMATLQETVAAPPILNLARRAGRLVDGEICRMESAMEELKIGMLAVYHRADLLRGSSVRDVIGILNSNQSVRVLAVAAEFQLRIRRWGVRRDLQRTTS